MRRSARFLPAVVLFLLLVALPCRAEDKESPAGPPALEMVKGPDKPTGRYAGLPGVVELFRLAAQEAEKGFEEMKTAYRSYIEKYDDQPVAVYYLAALLLRHGEKDEALKLVKEADRINPG